MKTKILLINAINPNVEVEQRHPPLGLAYLVSVLRERFGKDFFEFLIIDRDVENEIKNFVPDIVFISSVTQNFDTAINYANFVKQFNIPVVVGGIHITMMPLSLKPCFDVGVLGEGEEVIIELMDIFLKNKKFLTEDLKDIKNIIFRDGSNIQSNPLRPPIKNIDVIPMPARDLLKINRHTYMFTSRGCPYKCVFCASTRFWDKLRFFSADYVVREIRELVDEYNVRLISFYDDLFIADKNRLKEIVSLIKKDKKLNSINFTCNGRANLINDETVLLLREMHVRSINMGLESGCKRTLQFLKPQVALEQNFNAVKTVKKHRLACNGSFIIGSPEETKENMMETYNFIKKIPINLTDIYVLTPYPGTPIWDYALKKGLVSEDMSWSKLDVNFENNYEDAIILSETMSKEEIVEIFKKFHKLRFFKNLAGIITHPYLMDVPRMAVRILIEKFNLIFKGNK